MDEDKELSFIELFIISLTLYAIVSSIFTIISGSLLSLEVSKLMRFMDWFCVVVFLSEWLYRFFNSDKKIKFSIYNFPDLIASLPFWLVIESTWVWFLRLIKIFGNLKRTITYIRNNTFNALKYLITVPYLLILFLSPTLILYVEGTAEGGNITTAGDALWWVFCTVTTIGYGDFYPITLAGRVLTMVLAIGGISMFSLLGSVLLKKLVIDDGKN